MVKPKTTKKVSIKRCVLILPGYSVHNKDWMDEIAMNLLEIDGFCVVKHHWAHWRPGFRFSLVDELEEIAIGVQKCIDKCGSDGDGFVDVIAKSVGTRVVMEIVKRSTIDINRLILCGIPTRGKGKSSLNNYSPLTVRDGKNTFIFQNEKDPLASYVDVCKFIGSINKNIKIVKKSRSDHSYPYYGEFEAILTK